MQRKLLLIADPGIDTAFAIALALADKSLNVVGILPTAGNVPAVRATANVQLLVDRLDPPKFPRTASALPVEYEQDGTALHGPDGLGGLNLPVSTRHFQHPADRVLGELVREYPRELSVVCLGPATTLARAFDRDPDLPGLIDRLILVGGCHQQPGNAGPVSEFHFLLDPAAAKRCLHVGLHPLVIPLDVTRQLILSPTELLELPNPESRTCSLLGQILPAGIRASSNLYGIEGFHLKDVLGIAAVALPGAITSIQRPMDVETRGELTRGMLVVDARRSPGSQPNGLLATECAIGEVRQYIERVLAAAP